MANQIEHGEGDGDQRELPEFDADIEKQQRNHDVLGRQQRSQHRRESESMNQTERERHQVAARGIGTQHVLDSDEDDRGGDGALDESTPVTLSSQALRR